MTNPETMSEDERNEAVAVEVLGECRPSPLGEPDESRDFKRRMYSPDKFPFKSPGGNWYLAWRSNEKGFYSEWRPINLHTYEGMGRVIEAMKADGWAYTFAATSESNHMAMFTRTGEVGPWFRYEYHDLPTAVLKATRSTCKTNTDL